MLSIHINLSAGAQNITGTDLCNNYACLQMLVNKLTTHFTLPGKAAV